MDDESLTSFVLFWQNKFPIDRWWRQKHGIAFGSAAHRDSCFIDQLFEYKEDMLYNKTEKYFLEKEKNKDEWLKKHEQSEKDWLEESRKEMSKYYGDGRSQD